MPTNNRPGGHEKKVTGTDMNIHKRGEGLGTGKVGSSTPSGRPTAQRPVRPSQSGGSSGQRSVTRGGIKISLPLIIIAIVAFFLFKKCSGGVNVSDLADTSGISSSQTSSSSATDLLSSGSSLLSSFLGGAASSGYTDNTVSNGWVRTANTGKLNTSVDSAARAKYTNLLGNGNDTVTILVYMCGTDLESKSGMASSDLGEMAKATLSDKVNVIVYTGGCTKWKTPGISNQTNQIYRVRNGGLEPLEQNLGDKVMTDPNTLSSFIKYGAQKFSANRMALVFWDHGGGSLSGYGYDEKHPTSGSMGLAAINKALKDGGIKFDFIGFDACLMATAENALMLANYADYMIASEETEPGIGWYYTNWLNKLAANPSMPTLEIGKQICDDFVEQCNIKCNGQKTTLSVVDLSELSETMPLDLNEFAASASKLIQNNEYKTVSDARASAREFAVSSKIDQIDLVHFATGVGTPEGEALAKTLLSAVKYNRTAPSMTNSYGLSIYFPYRKTSSVKSAANTYASLGMDDAYGDCIKTFAGMQAGGQAVAGGTQTPVGTLTGSGSSSSGGLDVGSLLGSLMGGSFSGFDGGSDMGSLLGSLGGDSIFGSILGSNKTSEYLDVVRLDDDQLYWETSEEGRNVLALTEEQWSLVHSLDLNVWYDDGEGFIDLGLDNVPEYDDAGRLLGEYDGTWLAVNNHAVPYYHESDTYDGDAYVIGGYMPALVNDERAELLVVFDNEHPDGTLVGWRRVYHEGETETVAKASEALEIGDTIEFVCDYYDYNGSYTDSYKFGEPMTYDGTFEISYVNIDASKANATFLITDLYNQKHWTDVIPQY